MKKFIFITVWLLISFNLFSQNEQFCPGNFFDNGDLELGTPTGSDQDIDLAQGFNAIWGTGSVADFYTYNDGPFTYPSPATGNYAGFWVSNHPFSNSTWREGLYNTFLTPIAANTGNYSFNFDVACLYKDNGVNSDVELGVYGIYNPSASVGVSPTNQFTPDNLNIFPGNTILLGTIPLNGECSNIKQNVSVNISTAGMSIPSITHIMITHSDTVISYADGGGKRYIGVDNFCLSQDEKGETDYCCDADINEIRNGNFEGGNSGFSSAYSLGSNGLYGTVPGQYFIGNNTDGLAISSLWNVNDHSNCTIGSINDDVMFINGRTTQSLGTESVVYSQNVILSNPNEEKRYKFCANFKNMPQCTFDIIPQIDIRINGVSQTGGYVTLNNTTTSDPCSWELVGFDFTASGSINLEVFLKEDGLGDGNDFAMDDISIQELQDPNYSITVQHQGNPQQITGSLNSILNTDDELDCKSRDYCWFVVEVTNYSGSSLNYNINTFASGNSSGSSSYIPSYLTCNSPWNLTTTYPCYPFAQNTMYLIGLYTPPNPECCLDEGWTYQLTYNHRSSGGALSDDQKDEIRSMLACGGNQEGEANQAQEDKSRKGVYVYPNPASSVLFIKNNVKVKSYTIINYLGKSIKNQLVENNNLEKIDISSLDNGVYILSIINEDGSQSKSKFIKN